MNDLNKYLDLAKKYGLESVHLISRFRTLLTVAIAALAIFAAVLQAQEFLNPARNETTYTETKSQVTVKNIDQEILSKLEATQSDRTDTASSDFVPNRDNPFAE